MNQSEMKEIQKQLRKLKKFLEKEHHDAQYDLAKVQETVDAYVKELKPAKAKTKLVHGSDGDSGRTSCRKSLNGRWWVFHEPYSEALGGGLFKMFDPTPEITCKDCRKALKLAPLIPQCQAKIDDKARGKAYSQIRGAIYPSKQCSRESVGKCGELHLCGVHKRLCEEGFVSINGDVTPATMIRDCRNGGYRFETWYKEDK